MNTGNRRSYIPNIDQLVEQTPLDLVLQHYGLPLSKSNAREYRMNCVFNEACSDSQYGNLSVELDVANQIFCHRCSVRGNLLTLIHGLETRQPPTGGKLRGQEFKHAAETLRKINGIVDSSVPSSRAKSTQQRTRETTPTSDELPSTTKQTTPSFNINVPLHRHEKEAARTMADLYNDMVTEQSNMAPKAAEYVQKRIAWFTPELMSKWNVGWVPGRSLFRKHYFVYAHRNTRGDIVTYSGRDLNYETKREKWELNGKPNGEKPYKHRFVSGYKRGVELYGGHISRLEEPAMKKSLEQHGLVVVEGMNNVIRLDALGVCAVGVCSNKATNQQVDMMAKFAQQVGNNRIMLLPDCDIEGEEGFQPLLWKLAERVVDVRLGMSSQMFDDKFAGKQPEDLTIENWQQIINQNQ